MEACLAEPVTLVHVPHVAVAADLNHARHPKFIVFEGIDGSGKGSIIRRISKAFSMMGLAHITAKEPGGSDFGNALRDVMFKTVGTRNIDPLALDYVFFADHIHNSRQVIAPALAAGQWVLSDRYFPVVYPVYSHVTPEDRVPTYLHGGPDYDLLIILEGDPATLLERANNRPELHQSQKKWNKVSDMTKFRQAYHDQHDNNSRAWFIDTTDATVFDTFLNVRRVLDLKLGLRIPYGMAVSSNFETN